MECDVMVEMKDKKYFYDSKTEILRIYTLEGKEFDSMSIEKDSWVGDPKYWKMMLPIFKNEPMTKESNDELIKGIYRGVDWKECSIRERARKARDKKCDKTEPQDLLL